MKSSLRASTPLGKSAASGASGSAWPVCQVSMSNPEVGGPLLAKLDQKRLANAA